jgi:hypothetical protein
VDWIHLAQDRDQWQEMQISLYSSCLFVHLVRRKNLDRKEMSRNFNGRYVYF